MSKEAMKLALEIAIDYMNERLEDHDCKYQRHPATEAERINIIADIETVKETLAKQEQGEPVAWLLEQGPHVEFEHMDYHDGVEWTPLYTTPQQRTWVGLTDEEVVECWARPNMFHIAHAIESKLKEKNT